MSRATNGTTVFAFARQRLSSIVDQAERYHASALREAGERGRPWAAMIDTLFDQVGGFHELATLALHLGDPVAEAEITGQIAAVSTQLTDLAHDARMCGCANWDPLAKRFRPHGLGREQAPA
ncbi:MAG: hypothetical protein LCI02_04960 [Proteobacteria bacterium]|nr:hypothetical protein [Pseudomonadota bacterium]